MAPGQKPPSRTREPAETPLTDYERLRAQNMMKNNQMFQRLGLSTLATMINNTTAMSKDDVSQESGSLYDAQHSEGSEQEEVSKGRKDQSHLFKLQSLHWRVGSYSSSTYQSIHTEYYKKDEGQITNYIGKLAGQFTMDIKSKAVHEACTDLLKCGQRQMRHRLKKKYFDGVPANQVRTTSPIKQMTDEQWRELVEMWSSPKHKDKCIKNKLNREKVQFQQRTGSQCYIAKTYVVKQDKYKDIEPTAIDLFKETHCSRKIGFTKSVKKAIDDMEAIVAEPEHDGQHVKSSADAVSEVLPQSSKLLQNVGILSSKSSTRVGVSSKVQELQAQLEMEKQEKAELRLEMDSLKFQAQESESTMTKQSQEVDRLKDTIKSQAQQSEAAMVKQSEEIESLKKIVHDCSGFLRQMITFQGQVPPP